MARFVRKDSSEVYCKYPSWVTKAMKRHKQAMRDLEEKQREDIRSQCHRERATEKGRTR